MTGRLLLLAALAGCGPLLDGPEEPVDVPPTSDDTHDDTTPPDDTDTPGPTAEDPLASTTWEGATGGGGLVKVEVEVDENTAAFMVTGEADRYVSLERLLGPDGAVVLHWQDWWTSPKSLTNAFFGFDRATGFNWPVREEDGPLAPGTWTVELSTLDAQGNYVGDEPITLTVHRKADDDLLSGKAGVAILWADGVDDDPDVVAAVEGAVGRWQEVWGAYGMDIDVRYVPTSLDPSLDFTYTGSAELEAEREALDPGTLVVVVGDHVDGERGTYGVSGGIPGPLADTPMSFVVIGWLAHAGQDATFDASEIRLMGETMAHEVGHYAGLFHPVEWNYDFWDALEDTPDCDTWQSCEGAMADNLMFPYPVCDVDGCVPQDQLTADQQAVTHRYTGML